AHCFDEVALHEIFGCNLREFAIEVQDECGVDLRRPESCEPLIKSRQQWGRLFGTQYPCWMREERENCGHPIRLLRALNHAAQNLLMAEMDAIEVTNRHRGGQALLAESCAPFLKRI